MKLIFDCRFIRIDNHDGISRFSSELFTAISRKTNVTALISDERQLKWLPAETNYVLGNDPTKPLAELFLPVMLNKIGATHVFSPMQTMGTLGKKYKLVLTLHDLIYYSHPKAPTFLPLHVRIAWRIYHLSFLAVRILLNRADAVTTVSETSKRLIEQKKLTRRPVHVIYNAPTRDSIDVASVSQSTITRSKRLVYMGSFMEYKNVETLIAAMDLLPEYTLVLLSKVSEKRKRKLLELAGKSSSRIVFRNGVSEEEYSKELATAFALVSASKDEGFGIPLVEAMQHSTPLVVSNIAIFKEVAQDAAVYFNHNDPIEFAAAIRSLEVPAEWEKLSTNSRQRADFFNWDRSADLLLEVLEQI